jgi:hypothetical protein
MMLRIWRNSHYITVSARKVSIEYDPLIHTFTEKNCDLTAAPTRMASGSRSAQVRRHERSPAELSLQRRMMDKVPFHPSGIELPHEIDASFAGAEVKYRRVSELTGSESPLSPSSSSVRYCNHNHAPPISQISPDHMPGELYSPPSDDLGTTSYFVDVEPRRSRSIIAKTADDEVAGTNITERSRSYIPVCVNPWDVEHQPNPVIFSHLSSLGEAIPKRNVDDMTAFAPDSRALTSSRDAIGMLNPNPNGFEKLLALHAHSTILDLRPLTTLQAIDIETSDDVLPTLQSSISESSADDISPVTMSEGTLPFEGKQRYLENCGTVELINFAATTSYSTNSENSTAVSSKTQTWTNSGAVASPSQASSLSSPPNVSTPAVILASPASTEASSDPTYPCPSCHLSFRTPGLRRYVVLLPTVIVRNLLISSAVETIRTVNTTSDTPVNSASQDLGYERTSSGTKTMSTGMMFISFRRNCFGVLILTVRHRERRTLGRITSKGTYSVVIRPSLPRIHCNLEVGRVQNEEHNENYRFEDQIRPTCGPMRHTESNWRTLVRINQWPCASHSHADTHIHHTDRLQYALTSALRVSETISQGNSR